MINITKAEMVRLLKNYRFERESINSILTNLTADLGDIYYPASTCYDRPLVQQQPSIYAQIERLLKKCDEAQRHQREVLSQAKETTYILDRLIAAVWKLPAKPRALITAIVMDGESVTSFAERMNWSERSVFRHKENAVDRLYSILTKRPIEGDFAPNLSTE